MQWPLLDYHIFRKLLCLEEFLLFSSDSSLCVFACEDEGHREGDQKVTGFKSQAGAESTEGK